MNITKKIYFSSLIKLFSSVQLKAVHPFPKIIKIIEKKCTSHYILYNRNFKNSTFATILHNKDIVPEPGINIFPKNLENDIQLKDEFS